MHIHYTVYMHCNVIVFYLADLLFRSKLCLIQALSMFLSLGWFKTFIFGFQPKDRTQLQICVTVTVSQNMATSVVIITVCGGLLLNIINF